MNVDQFEYEVPTLNISYNRIFMISDLHFGVRNNSIEWLENHLEFFHKFYIPYLKENLQKGDVLFVLGDWFDNRQLLDINVMNKSIDLILDLSEILPVYFMTGNHDIYKKIHFKILLFRNCYQRYKFQGISSLFCYGRWQTSKCQP